MYQAPPNSISQIAGLGTSILGAYGLYKGLSKAEGGVIKGYAGGGLVSLALSNALKG
jgi:hypothetical protein